MTNIFPPINEVRYLNNKNGNGQSIFIAGGDEGAIFSNDSAINWRFFDNEKHSSLAFYNKESGLSFYPVSSGGRGLLKFVGPFTSINKIDNHIGQFSITIYPNPVNDQLNVYYTSWDKETEFVVQDLTGKVIKSVRVNNTNQENKITMNTTDLEKGIYFLTASNIGCLKFVKD